MPSERPCFIPNIVYKNIAITFLLLHAAAELWLPAQTAGFTALAVGFILLAKLRELHHHELLRKHYVRTYYLLQLFAATGYLWTGAAKLQNLPSSAPLHLITLGGMMGGVMMVWLTAGLWHSGFTKLDYPNSATLRPPALYGCRLARFLDEREPDIFHYRSCASDYRRVRTVSFHICTDISGKCVYG